MCDLVMEGRVILPLSGMGAFLMTLNDKLRQFLELNLPDSVAVRIKNTCNNMEIGTLDELKQAIRDGSLARQPNFGRKCREALQAALLDVSFFNDVPTLIQQINNLKASIRGLQNTLVSMEAELARTEAEEPPPPPTPPRRSYEERCAEREARMKETRKRAAAYKKIHGLPPVQHGIVLATAAGCRTLGEITDWLNERESDPKRRRGMAGAVGGILRKWPRFRLSDPNGRQYYSLTRAVLVQDMEKNSHAASER